MFNSDIPGWVTEKEANVICDIISKTQYTDILEVGPFIGRLTNSICKNFPERNITVLDSWNNQSLRKFKPHIEGNRYTIENGFHSKDLFISFNNFSNLKIIEQNYYAYNNFHDIIVLSLFPDFEGDTWQNIIEYTLSLSPKLIIGRHVNLQKDIIVNYNCEIVSENVYTKVVN